MPHIHTEPGQHDLTTTAFIIRTDSDEPQGLLHMHKKLFRLLPPGGHVELNETPWAAVLHEVEEEAGYDPDQLRVLQPKDRITKMDGTKVHPVPLYLQTHEFGNGLDHSHSDVGFLFITDEPPRNEPKEGEASELFWLTNLQIQSQVSGASKDVAQIYDFCFKTALRRWESVPLYAFDL